MVEWKKRIIIGGLPRSGSTLLRWHLDAAKEIVSPPETTFFQFLLCTNQERIGGRCRRINKALQLGESEISNIILSSQTSVEAFDRLMVKWAEKRGVKASIWAEKTPWNCLSYQWLSNENQEIWFISTIRDGRDVVTSEHWKKNRQYHCEIQRYIDVMSIIYSFSHENHIIVSYEDLVEDIEGTMKKIFQHIGISWCKNMIQDAQKEDEFRSALSDRQPMLTKQPDSSRIGRWREDDNEQRITEFLGNSRAVEWLKRSGYTP